METRRKKARGIIYRVFIQRNGEPSLFHQTRSLNRALEEARRLLEGGERIVYIEQIY